MAQNATTIVSKVRSTASISSRLREFASPYSLLTAGLIGLFVFLIAFSLGVMIWETFIVKGQLQVKPFVDLFHASWLPTVLFNTAIVVGVSTVISVASGAVLAWINERTDAGFGMLGTLLPVIPLMLPGVAVAIGWVFIGAPKVGYLNGLLAMLPAPFGQIQVNINSWTGLIFVYSLNGIPYVYLILSGALKNLDPALEEAARISGAGIGRTLRTVALPAVRPALIAAGLLVMIHGLGTFSTAVIIATPANVDLLTTRIVSMLTRSYPPDFAGAQILSLLMLIAVALVWWIQQRTTKGGQFVSVGGRAAGSGRLPLGGWRPVARLFTVVTILLTAVLPAVALVIVAIQPYWSATISLKAITLSNFEEAIFTSRLTVPAFKNSLLISAAGATIAMGIAIVAAIFVSIKKNALGGAIDFLLKLPAILPHLIIAIGFLIAFGGAPFYMSGTLAILILAMVVMYISPGAIAAAAAVTQIGNDLSEASRVSGAGEGRTVAKIIIPLALPGFVAGWTLVFVQMVGDLSAAAILAGLRTPVIGFAIIEIWEAGTFGTLAAFSAVLCLVNIFVVGSMMLAVRLYSRSIR
jgi:iron(III) transport system permease protein